VYNLEDADLEDKEIVWEQFPEKEEKVVVKKAEGDEEEEAEQPPPEDEEENKKPKFNVEDHKWTVTDRKPKNLPKLFLTMKGISGAFEPNKTAA
jgi:hypothetical protein